MLVRMLYLLYTIVSADGLDDFLQSECGITKSCLRWSSCDFSNCDFGFSWRAINFNSTQYLEVELVGSSDSDLNGYLGFGISEVSKMVKNAAVVCCFENGRLEIRPAFNVDHYQIPLNYADLDENYMVRYWSTRYGIEYDVTSKMIRCRFLRLISPTKEKDKLKDLSIGRQFYLLSSKGRLIDSAVKYHFSTKKSSVFFYDLLSSNRVNNIITSNYMFVKIHACFMVIGWIFFATNGIMIANFYKGNWASVKICREKIWFQIHRLVQTMCILCVSTGFIIIFINVGGFSALVSLPNTAHPIMGIVATGLMFINPIIALFRCHPDSPSRWIFNRLHLMIGITAYILAICTMTIGIQLPPAGPNLSNINYPWILVIVFLSLIMVLFIYGEIRNHLRKKSKIINQMIMNPDQSNLQIQNQKLPSGMEVILISVVLSVGFGVVLLILVLLN